MSRDEIRRSQIYLSISKREFLRAQLRGVIKRSLDMYDGLSLLNSQRAIKRNHRVSNGTYSVRGRYMRKQNC